MGSRTTSPLSEPGSPVDGIRKRVCKACDRCRLKKSKCDGSSPCSRCKADNAICVFGERKKSHDKIYPKGYVEMLEHQQEQLVTGLQELYRLLQAGDVWPGTPLKQTAKGTPLTHDILERLGALKSDHDNMDYFEESPEALQSRLFANGALPSSMHRERSFDAASELDQSPSFESTFRRDSPVFGNPWARQSQHYYPPTPPTASPHPSIVKTSSPLKAEMSMATSHYAPDNEWQSDPTDMDIMDYNTGIDTSIYEAHAQGIDPMAQMYSNATAINPQYLMNNSYAPEDISSRYYQRGVFT